MGRQIEVKLQALDVLCHLDYYEEQYEFAEEPVKFVTVCTPEWHTITLGVFGDSGCVDCRGPGSPNHWFEEWMVNNKVLYLDS